MSAAHFYDSINAVLVGPVSAAVLADVQQMAPYVIHQVADPAAIEFSHTVEQKTYEQWITDGDRIRVMLHESRQAQEGAKGNIQRVHMPAFGIVDANSKLLCFYEDVAGPAVRQIALIFPDQGQAIAYRDEHAQNDPMLRDTFVTPVMIYVDVPDAKETTPPQGSTEATGTTAIGSGTTAGDRGASSAEEAGEEAEAGETA